MFSTIFINLFLVIYVMGFANITKWIAEVDCSCWEDTYGSEEAPMMINSFVNSTGKAEFEDLCYVFLSGENSSIQKLDCMKSLEPDGAVYASGDEKIIDELQ
eukprot:NODE_125_length_18781_cov_0.243015.p13 type:complete len:102 gc:universal NODE_125_length_18781_cov_0.243015:1583-1888(+)